ncbi:MAG: leucyl/phenylalanyl-tRNA--protein transferase [Rhodobacterales bacterium]|nr:leucyl/phenylalanyl-tRNA--protein transferase [Rhodobacterales bacterium]MDX5412656.1 leucyl/phenylalanyl-tRNA--protein transferase [Rhodobacterales bacterium]
MTDPVITPELLLNAYAAGIFPMAETRDDPDIFWVDPRRRGIFPLDRFHVSRSLARRMRRWPHGVTINRAFAAVVDACAARDETWINAEIRRLYQDLHRMGHAHSLEIWEGEDLVGGVYGVTLGAAFFGESMFSRRTDASKIALAYLVDRLRQGGFTLFDAQFLTPHLASLGAVEVTRAEYHRQLETALAGHGDFVGPAQPDTPQAVVQRITQTS